MINSVRELSKCMTKRNIETYNQMLRVISYLNIYKNYGIKLKCNQKMNENIDLKFYVDSDWGGDTVNRKRISGCIIMFNGNPILWRSKRKSIVAQSSSEDEYISTSDSCKDLVFVIRILSIYKFKMNFPEKIMFDNKGSIFMKKNSSIKKNKHIHTMYLFVKEYIENGILDVEYIKSENKLEDPLTKCINKDLFQKNMERIISKVDPS